MSGLSLTGGDAKLMAFIHALHRVTQLLTAALLTDDDDQALVYFERAEAIEDEWMMAQDLRDATMAAASDNALSEP